MRIIKPLLISSCIIEIKYISHIFQLQKKNDFIKSKRDIQRLEAVFVTSQKVRATMGKSPSPPLFKGKEAHRYLDLLRNYLDFITNRP